MFADTCKLRHYTQMRRMESQDVSAKVKVKVKALTPQRQEHESNSHCR
jgi:hypothetical protein